MQDQENTTHAETFEFMQLKKYAKALSDIYSSEKNKRRELEESRAQLMKYASALNESNAELRKKNRELKNAYKETIQRLVSAAEYKDKTTGNHIVRIANYSMIIVDRLGLSGSDSQNIYYAAPMHDIGKIGIPDSILNKPGKLSIQEYGTMKTHTTIGAAILEGSSAEVLQIASNIALTHHEKWDGSGYPNGLRGTDIPLSGRIVSIADVFDALTSTRPYKKPFPPEEAFTIIRNQRSLHFDPELVDIFLDSKDDVIEVKEAIL